MKTIGFIDCFLDNFHANKYPEFIAQYNEKNGTDFAVKYAWAEEDLAGGKTNDDWCKEHNVERCATIKEVCEKSDFVMILAPARPDTHLRYCEEAFKYGKLTYVDKTFAPDFATAKKIFELAEKHNKKIYALLPHRLPFIHTRAIILQKEFLCIATFTFILIFQMVRFRPLN